VCIASIGRDDNPTVPYLESTLDAGEFPIQVLKIFPSRFSQHAVKRYHATKLLYVDCWLRMIFFASIRYSIGIMAVGSDQL